MRMSKSFAVLTSDSEAVPPDLNRPPRRRSSLDTFVIPGRTRLPSSRVSHPEPMDLKIAQSLLNAESGLLPRKSSYPGKVVDLNPPKHRRSNGPLQRIEHSKEVTSDSPSISYLYTPKSRSDYPLDIGPQGHQVDGVNEHIFPRRTPHRGSGSGQQDLGNYDLPISYDAPNEVSSNGSRNTTSTWTTVSGRDFTSPFADFYRLDPSQSNEEYNRLAREQGLPKFEVAPDRRDNESRYSLASTASTRGHDPPSFLRQLIDRRPSMFNMKSKVGGPKVRRKGSTLEEISRLGGVSILILPHDFAALDKLVVPSCVSATVRYLVQNGCRAPGVFRVPGQVHTVSKLYKYYSDRFRKDSKIDHPDKIQSTVGSGDLPAHIEYTVHDVASLLKKILLGFPGGLLGSLSLLKAIASIAEKFEGANFVALRVRLIALAISSVTSDHRFSLICAILGLAALIGHESEKSAHRKSNGSSSELMSYQALSLVLGPLLLGDALNDLLTTEDPGPQRNPIAESPKRSRKQKRESAVESKILQSDALVAHVRTAKTTAKACEMLITNWKDVVKQLRGLVINGPSGSPYQATEQQPASGRDWFTFASSEDGLVRGTHPSDVFGEPSESAKKARHSNSRSRPKRSSSPEGPIWLHDACFTNSSEGAPLLPSSGKKASKARQLHLPRTDERKGSRVHFAGHSGRSSHRQSSLQHGMDAPIPGELILRHPFIAADMTRVTKLPYETQDQVENTPANEDHTSGLHDARSSTNARLIDDHGANARGEPGRPDWFDPKFHMSAEGTPEDAQLMADSFGRKSDASSYNPASSCNNVGLLAKRFSPPSQGHYVPDSPRDISGSKVYANVYAAAIETQLSSPPVPENDTYPTVFIGSTEIQSSPPQVPEKDCRPSLNHSKSDLGRGKESLIPRPVHELGRARRKAESGSPSPSKETTPMAQIHKRPSTLDVLLDDRLSIAVSDGSNGPDNNFEDVHVDSFATNPASTPSRSAPRVPFIREAPTTSSMTACSPVDAIVRSASSVRLPSSSNLYMPTESDSAQRNRSPSISQNSESGSIRHLSPASRSNTANTSALFAEISRLKRELERKSEEANQARRSLDVVRETGSSRERSCSREESSNEKDMRKQLEVWKRRAEEAERKLRRGINLDEVMRRQTSEDAIESLREYPTAERTSRKIVAGSDRSSGKAPQAAIQNSPGISSIKKLEAEQITRKGPVGGAQSRENASQGPIPTDGPGGGVHSPRNGPHVTFQPSSGGPSSGRRTQQRREYPPGAATFWKKL